jgi:ribonuclease HI
MRKPRRKKVKRARWCVVWEGVTPGIYPSWDEAKYHVLGYSKSKYKSYDTLAEAQVAYAKDPSECIGVKRAPKTTVMGEHVGENITHSEGEPF